MDEDEEGMIIDIEANAAQGEGRVWADFPVLLPVERVGEAPVIYPLSTDMSEELLDLLIAGKDTLPSFWKRVISSERLKKEFRDWRANRAALAVAAPTVVTLISSLIDNVLLPTPVPAKTRANLFQWINENLREKLPPEEAALLPETRAAFEELHDKRSSKLVNTRVFGLPERWFIHIPLLGAANNLFADEELVCTPSEQFAKNERTGQNERIIREYWHGKKFAYLHNIAGTRRFIVWQLFVDETRWTIRHGRQVHGLYARVANHPRGCWELIGLVPTITDIEGKDAGLSQKECVLARLAIVQACISAVILGGGMEENYAGEMVWDHTGELVVGKMYLGSINVDGKGICTVTSRILVTSLKHAPLCACYRHRIPTSRLSEPVGVDVDDTHNYYLQDAAYKARLLQLIGEADGSIRGGRNKGEIAAELQGRGLYPIVPGYFLADGFDGSRDVLGDIQHVGPEGVGKVLLENLCGPVLLCVFPPSNGEGVLREDVYPTAVEAERSEMQGDKGLKLIVCLTPPPELGGRPGFHWCVDAEDNNHAGFVAVGFVRFTVTFDHDYKEALAFLDSGLTKQGAAYVRGASRFDFPSLASYVDDTPSSGFFSRATTVELVLKYIPYCLAVLLEKFPLFSWITETFVRYNQFYFAWRQDFFFESDLPIIGGLCFSLQEILNVHWKGFSKTQLNFMKFEQLSHVILDLAWHTTVASTSTGDGDRQHRVTKKIIQVYTNKTSDEESLAKQVASFGPLPCFLREKRAPLVAKSPAPIGRGDASLLNKYIMDQVRVLRRHGWGSEECNAPTRALDGLRELWNKKYGHTLDLNEFSLLSIRIHHTLRLTSNVKIYASDSYKGAQRHDFVQCANGSYARVVGIVSVQDLWSDWIPFVVLEEALIENVDALDVLKSVVISETEKWTWSPISAVVAPIVTLRHPVDRAWHFVIQSKRDYTLVGL